ncbi:hypothetical protein SK128_001556 [Halocaridina rubra]|uniref:Uncharacterized protein n=1 Tax=Halocaridina rubra TaxID=373956 RepID=A0AAN8XSG4_HALRR
MPYLSEENKRVLDLFHREFTGLQEPMERWEFCIQTTSKFFGLGLGSLYERSPSRARSRKKNERVLNEIFNEIRYTLGSNLAASRWYPVEVKDQLTAKSLDKALNTMRAFAFSAQHSPITPKAIDIDDLFHRFSKSANQNQGICFLRKNTCCLIALQYDTVLSKLIFMIVIFCEQALTVASEVASTYQLFIIKGKNEPRGTLFETVTCQNLKIETSKNLIKQVTTKIPLGARGPVFLPNYTSYFDESVLCVESCDNLSKVFCLSVIFCNTIIPSSTAILFSVDTVADKFESICSFTSASSSA